MRNTLEGSAQVRQAQAATARFGALRYRNFRLIWTGLVISNTGTWMQMVAQGWLVLELTNSPFYLGLVALSRAIPTIIFSLFGGVFADRINKIKLLVITQTSAMILALILATLTTTGRIQVWHILALSFISAAVLAFDQPTRHALLPNLVPREEFSNAIALNSVAFSGAGVLGPAIAGLLIALIGAGGIFYINAISYLAVLIALFMMRIDISASSAAAESVWRNLREGLRYVKGAPIILSLLAISIVTSIFGNSYNVLLPVFARDLLVVGAVGFGFLMAAPGVGTLVSGFGLAFKGDVERKGLYLIISSLLGAVLLFVFAISSWFPLSLVCLAIVGFASTFSGMMISTLLQSTVPNEMRGRIMSAYILSFMGFTPLGSMLLGAIADVAGAQLALGLGAGIVVAAVVAIGLLHRQIWKI